MTNERRNDLVLVMEEFHLLVCLVAAGGWKGSDLQL
ncbi:hypothetical protein NC651_013499 [Populus alba x Populus x berolinensis]|nr:hypothetical protein NC651_013499 [Populus alba x Populus x berolinensis]